MPEKLHSCVNDMGLGMDSDKAWKICNSSIKEQVANAMVSMTEGLDKQNELMESHNPLDIPFGYELTETVCKPCVQDKANKKAVMESMLGRTTSKQL